MALKIIKLELNTEYEAPKGWYVNDVSSSIVGDTVQHYAIVVEKTEAQIRDDELKARTEFIKAEELKKQLIEKEEALNEEPENGDDEN